MVTLKFTGKRKVRTNVDVIKQCLLLCNRMLDDLEKAQRPILQATKCSLDNCLYDHAVGFLTAGDKRVSTELNVSSVKKMSRAIFMLEILMYIFEKFLQPHQPIILAIIFGQLL